MHCAWAERAKVIDESRMKLTLHLNVPGAAESLLDQSAVSELLDFRKNLVNQWAEHFKIVKIEVSICHTDMAGG